MDGLTLADAAIEMPRLLIPGLAERESLNDYQARGGYAQLSWAHEPVAFLDLVAASGLRGRGGAGFPTGTKMRSVAAQPGPRVLLVNGAESEPAGRKDRELLRRRPHLVIEGALLAAQAIQASEIVFYLHATEREVVGSIDLAHRELKAAGWRMPRWRIVTAAPGYVAGEETAAIQRANGRAAKPTFKPPLPFQRGVRNRPTLVQNVETLAHLPSISREGPEWFRSVGTEDLPGTLLVTLSGAVRRPGVYEVPAGTPLRTVIDHYGGGTPTRGIQAVLPGGYFGGWLSGSAVTGGILLERDSLAAHGVSLGSAAIVVVPEHVCGLTQAVALLQFFAAESARQCGPCTHGTRAMSEALERLADGTPEPDDLKRLRYWSERVLPRRGACGHLDGAAVAASTALRVFADEIERHLRHGGCGRSARVALPGLGEEPAYAGI